MRDLSCDSIAESGQMKRSARLGGMTRCALSARGGHVSREGVSFFSQLKRLFGFGEMEALARPEQVELHQLNADTRRDSVESSGNPPMPIDQARSEAAIAAGERLEPRESFDRFLAKLQLELHAPARKAAISGLRHLNADGSNRQVLARELSSRTELLLVREPDNSHSRHAVKVCDPQGRQLGYLPNWFAKKHAAPALDSGGIAEAFVESIEDVYDCDDAGQPGGEIIEGESEKLSVLLRVFCRPSFQNPAEFAEWCVSAYDANAFVWASITGYSSESRQDVIDALERCQEVDLAFEFSERTFEEKISIKHWDEPFASISKGQREVLLDGQTKGEGFRAFYFDSEDTSEFRRKPRVLILRF